MFGSCDLPNANFGLFISLVHFLGYFWLFLENPDIQVTVNITINHHYQQGSVYLQQLKKFLEPAMFCHLAVLI